MDWTQFTLTAIQALLLIAILCPLGIALFRFFVNSAVQAIFIRNVRSYFSGIIGYLFIIVFVVIAAICSFRPQFFTNNLANLDALSEFFPMLLLFMVPAITMGAWAEERKQGTDELLFTLPVNDFDVLLGKYLAVLAVYTITLGFSLTEVGVLAYLGDPDWGVLVTTYLGYWLAGAMLLSAGMFASALTNNSTVAFVYGSIFCAIPVFSGKISSSGGFFEAIAESSWFESPLLSWIVSIGSAIGDFFSFLGLGDLARSLSLQEQLREFTQGTIPVSGLMYFVLFTLFMLYLNLIVISKRHWAADQSRGMKLHYLVRTVALAAILISLHKMAFLGTARADLTSENIYTLSTVTVDSIDEIENDRPVTIQAYLSPTVPREFVSARKKMVGLLKQIDQIGGSKLKVRFVDVEPYSDEANVAEHYGIVPQAVSSNRDGRTIQENIFMGVVVSSNYDEIVLPFIGTEELIEYELTRSLRTVSKDKRKTIGILNTDARVIGGSREWEIVRELRKQYVVESVSPFSPIEETKFKSGDPKYKADEPKYDALLVIMPSSLTEPEMENLLTWVKHGNPTLIFADPFPYMFNGPTNIRIAPKLPKPAPPRNPMMMQRPPQSPPKADEGKLTRLLRLLGISWKNDEIVWDTNNPHPALSEVSPDLLFVTRNSVKDAISTKSPITSGLQELLLAYSGTIQNRKNSTNSFTPLLLTSPQSGLHGWDKFTTSNIDFMQRRQVTNLSGNRLYQPDDFSHILAAHITASKDKKLNVVFVSDIDVVTDWSFQQRLSDDPTLKLDNVTFILNALDVIAGDESFLKLRGRREKLRKLERVETERKKFTATLQAAEKEAEQKAEEELKNALKELNAASKEIQDDSTLDDRAKQERLQNIAQTVIRKKQLAGQEIERNKEAKIKAAKQDKEQQIRTTEDRIRYLAILLPPIPAIFLGLLVLFIRINEERKNITADRLVRR